VMDERGLSQAGGGGTSTHEVRLSATSPKSMLVRYWYPGESFGMQEKIPVLPGVLVAP